MRIRNLWLSVVLLAGPSLGNEVSKVGITDRIQFRTGPIDYWEEGSTDVIVSLKSKLEQGTVTLKRRDSSGYLLDLLDVLNVPLESQTLVFSRTSLQEAMINPKNPRAIYFNDEVTIG